ncbi:MAG: glucosylglycerol hydrolase, partial [Alkalispirochaeta sp.]
MSTTPVFDRSATAGLCSATDETARSADTAFDAARTIVATLGARPTAEGAVFGFWTPELVEEEIPESQVYLELFIPHGPVDLTTAEQNLTFQRYLLATSRSGEYTWSAVREVPVGTRERLGALYRLIFTDQSGTVRRIGDPLAASLPFGAAAPAELYDMERLLASRKGSAHFTSVAA